MNPKARTPKRRPFVLVNLAVTADGRIATANRRITTFGSRYDRNHLYQLRATTDAILCGARTAEQSRAVLDTGEDRLRRQRLRRGLAKDPLRVVASGHASLSDDAPILRPAPSPLVILATSSAPLSQVRRLENRGAVVAQFGEDELDLRAALAWLRRHWQVRRMVLEGGSQLHAAMLDQGLVDEIHLTLCPFLFGGKNAPTLADGPPPRTLDQAHAGRLRSARRIGQEIYLTYAVSTRGREEAGIAAPKAGRRFHA